MKKSNLLFFIIFTLLISCHSKDVREKEKTIHEQQEYINQLEHKLKEKTQVDTPSYKVSDPPDLIQSRKNKTFVSGRFKSLPEMVKSVFIEGSSDTEIKSILGAADFIDKKDMYREIWYYGQLEIEFYNRISRKIMNAEKCKQYLGNEIEFSDLLTSPDRVERKFANRIIERKTGIILADD